MQGAILREQSLALSIVIWYEKSLLRTSLMEGFVVGSCGPQVYVFFL